MAIGGAITGTAEALVSRRHCRCGWPYWNTALGAGAAGIVGYGVGTAATNKFDETR